MINSHFNGSCFEYNKFSRFWGREEHIQACKLMLTSPPSFFKVVFTVIEKRGDSHE